jgi:hypothetical protein
MARTARPRKSRFMGHAYKIKYEAGVVHEGRECYGVTAHDAKCITIEEGMDALQEADTLIHEMLHQMFAYSGIEFEDEVEEQIVTFLGSAISGHMADNLSCWRYLLRSAANAHKPPPGDSDAAPS